MEMIGRISKGSKMDQVYIPKNRVGLDVGSYVVISPAIKLAQESKKKLYYYGVKEISSMKIEMINIIMSFIDSLIKSENIIITGSFLDKGFNFNDIDIIIISDVIGNAHLISQRLKMLSGIDVDVLLMNNKSLSIGLQTDPLYQLMLSRCVSMARMIYKTDNKVKYRLLDLHLIKSKSFAENFDFLTERERYAHIRNVLSIKMFIENRRLNNETLEKEIKSALGYTKADILENQFDKGDLIKKYKTIYVKLASKILESIKYESKQK